MKKRIFSKLICFILAAMSFCTIATAATYAANWYTLSKPNEYGGDMVLTAANEEYTQVSVNTSGGESVTVGLYKKRIFQEPLHYGDDQTLTYGSGRRAWWYGDTTGNATYCLLPETSAASMSLSGYFRNYQ